MTAATDERLSVSATWTYASLSFATALMLAPISALLPNFYAENTAVTLGMIGAIVAGGRLFDALLDPLVGNLVDRTHGRFGSHKPWIVGGSVLLGVSGFMLLSPPADAGAAYLALWHTLTMVGWASVYIPYVAMGATLTSDYHERSRLVAARTVCGLLGAVLFFALPLLPQFESTAFDRDVMRAAGITLGVLMPVAAIALAWGTRERAVAAEPTNTSWLELVRIVKRNALFQRYLLAKLIYGLANGMYAAGFVIFMSSQLQMGDYVAHALLLSLVVALVTVPAWLAAFRRFGKHRVTAVSGAAFALLSPAILLCAPGALLPLLALAGLTSIVNGAAAVGPPAILADIIDYDQWKTGDALPGNYFAVEAFFEKANIGLGTALALVVLQVSGFEVGQINSGIAAFGMAVAVVWAPCALFLVAALIWWRFPLTERRHRAIRTRIDRRTSGARADALRAAPRGIASS